VIELSGLVEDTRVNIFENALMFRPGYAIAHGGFAGERDVALILYVHPFGVRQPRSAISAVTRAPLFDHQIAGIVARCEHQRSAPQRTIDKSLKRFCAEDVVPFAHMLHQVRQRMKTRQIVERSTAA